MLIGQREIQNSQLSTFFIRRENRACSVSEVTML